MDIEQRLKDHMAESGRLLNIRTEDPVEIMNAAPPRSGNVIRLVAALLVVGMGGIGFWLLSDDGGGTTEIAAGEVEDSDENDDGQQPSDDKAGAGEGTGPINPKLELTNITSDISPGNGRSIIENDTYYVLSTAPGRVTLDWNLMGEEEFMRLTRANSFYVYDESEGWSVSTIEDRFVSDFDVKDGLLYVISTGSANGDQASIGTSSDRGESWDWQDVNGLPNATSVTIMATDDQPLIFGSRWGNPDYEEAIKLAAGAGIDLLPMTLYHVDGQGFTYVPVTDENRCDVVLSQYVPGLIEMSQHFQQEESGMSDREVEEMLNAELGWIEQEVTSNGCELPADIDSLGFDDVPDIPEPVTKTWEGLGISTPETWNPWSGVFRYDGNDLAPLDLPYGQDVQTSFATKFDGTMTVRVFDPSEFDRVGGPEGETMYRTSDGIIWTEEFQPFPQNDEEHFAAFQLETNEFRPAVAGNRSFRLNWNEVMMEEEPIGEDWIEPQPLLQQRVDGGEWQTINVDDIIGERQREGRQLWEVRGTSVGVFLLFGPQWTENGEAMVESMLAVYTRDGEEWHGLELEGQNVQFINNDDEVMVLATTFEHADGLYSVTESYLVRPEG